MWDSAMGSVLKPIPCTKLCSGFELLLPYRQAAENPSAAPPALWPELLFPSAWPYLRLGSHPQLMLPALAAAGTAFPDQLIWHSGRGPYACHTASPWSSINSLCRQVAWLVTAMSLPLWEGFSWICIRVNQLADLIQLCTYQRWPCFTQ